MGNGKNLAFAKEFAIMGKSSSHENLKEGAGNGDQEGFQKA